MISKFSDLCFFVFLNYDYQGSGSGPIKHLIIIDIEKKELNFSLKNEKDLEIL